MEKLGSAKFHIGGREGGGLKNLSREFKFGEYRVKITGNLNKNLHTLVIILVSSIITVAVDSNP